MNVDVGDRIRAKKTVRMSYHPEDICLIKGKIYEVKDVSYKHNIIAIDSEIDHDHLWEIDSLDNCFRLYIGYINKKIKIL